MKKEEKIRLYYGIFLGIFTVAVGILFIVQAALIYYGGDSPDGKNYTREIAGEKLKQILIPLCFYIAAVIAGFVLSVVFPVTAKLKAKRSAGETAAFLRRRLPIGEPTEEFLRAKKWEKARWGVRAAALCVTPFILRGRISTPKFCVCCKTCCPGWARRFCSFAVRACSTGSPPSGSLST